MARVWAVLAIAGLFAVLAPACGGAEEPAAEGSPTPRPTGEEAALAPCRALQAFETYRYSANLKLESPEPSESPPELQPTPTSALTRAFTGPFAFEYDIDGSFVAPDRFQAWITGDGNSFGLIVIGSQSWIQTEPEGRWTPTTEPYQMPYKPLDICEAVLPDLDVSQAQPQEEKLNDVKALHYTFSQVHSEQAWAKIYGPGSDLDILLKKLDVDLWLAEKDKWPVRMEIRSSGLYGDERELRARILADVRDTNSDDIRVEPPS